MSLLAKLFGGKGKGDKAPTPAEAIQRLRDIEEMLGKKSEYLEKKVESELAIAKKNGTKNKRVALQALKRKKRYEKQLQQIDGTLSTIEFQREALENASTNTEVLKVMGTAAKALKAAHNNMDVDKVHDIMDEISEQTETANEIAEAISNPVGLGETVDEDDLLAELEELEQEALDEEMLSVPNTDHLPSVPTEDLPAATPAARKPAKQTNQEEEDEMRELLAFAS